MLIKRRYSTGKISVDGLKAVPLPEHPRPDWERSRWRNLNGQWAFRFDPRNEGLQEAWYDGKTPFPLTIQVPFSWAAPLSGLTDEAVIGWYAREIRPPAAWVGRRVFLVIGAADWHSTVWIDGQKLGSHQGGYIPFAFELSPYLKAGQHHRLVIRVDDTPHAFKLEGKQGYGQMRGIWQTVYLEVRGDDYLENLPVYPNIQEGKIRVKAVLAEPASKNLPLLFTIRGEGMGAFPVEAQVEKGKDRLDLEIQLPQHRLWTPDDPYLYRMECRLGAAGPGQDVVNTYFGMREISVVQMPGTNYPYVALNGQPVYLQLALDQAYHPSGYYTFPNDATIRNEILRARQIGLTGLRVHVIVCQPRKLYWADRLGVLLMADVPNAWGQPEEPMRQETEYTMREMIRRDFNHPSIFSWVIFNETWGLQSPAPEGNGQTNYLPETQQWVSQMYQLAKRLDPTRLVEDNSVCCGFGHTQTDLNSWHNYLCGWEWDDYLSEVSAQTFPGSTWNFEEGFQQDSQPNINSEFGNVWAYEGSTGDVDWSWDYHRALNAFRRHPKIAGWLYTEHHDVINEWNGYWRYDRTLKHPGLDSLVKGMTLSDLHSPLYLSIGGDLSRGVKPGETIQVPLYASFLCGQPDLPSTLNLRIRLYGWDSIGQEKTYFSTMQPVSYQPWLSRELPPLELTMPEEPVVLVLALVLEDDFGTIYHRNFSTFVVEAPAPEYVKLRTGRQARLLSIPAAQPTHSNWSQRQWTVMEGHKINGTGFGFFEYKLPWPADLLPEKIETAMFVMEASAKQLFGKDREPDPDAKIDDRWMLGGGTYDSSLNPNSYPMTDDQTFPSAFYITFNDESGGRHELPDDPADHRGILSWHAQLRDKRLREAGSYGYLFHIPVPAIALRLAAETGILSICLRVDKALPGGLAIYSEKFGRFPITPSVVVVMR